MDKYTLKQKLGSGSYAEVYLIVEKSSGKEFALKMLDKQKAGRKGMKQALVEVDILRSLRHNNVIALYDTFDTPQALCMVLELVEGGELFDQIVALKHYSESSAARLTRNLCLTLAHLHENGVAHRDIKPENLMLKERVTAVSRDDVSDAMLGNIKLVDFGFAARFQDRPFTECLGTPNFIAPEILLHGLFNQIKTGYDEKADMWSVGVLAYILLCGYPPFHDQSRTELFKKICYGRFAFHPGTATRPSVWDRISDTAKHFVLSLMQRDPAKRLSAAQALQHPWLVSAAPDEPLPETQRALATLQKVKGAVHGIGAATRLLYLQKCKQLQQKANSGLVAMLTEMNDHNMSVCDLGTNYLGKRGIETLLTILPSLRIRKLVLSDNQIDSEIVAVVVPHLRSHPTVSAVDLRRNPISMLGARQLLSLLQANQRICELQMDFEECPSYRQKVEDQLARNQLAAMGMQS
eukprot:TRINITY_DN1536_c0_g1_i1.p1 TRINITY_DN1536_c0_g1~~TRINITY_DN1536_c0_g1_i1.p1  ORF type:complete len:465 (+),score=125.27 TRINITY_DN1536_c0_g1_i1:328-1722(+)